MSDTSPTETGGHPEPPRPRPAWGGRDILFAVLGGAALGVVVLSLVAPLLLAGRVAGPVSGAISGSVLYLGLFVSIWFFIVRRRGVTWEQLGWRWAGAAPVAAMIPLSLATLFATGIAALISQKIFGDVPTARDQLLLGREALSSTDVLALLILVSVAAPVVEETFFRGVLQSYLRTKTSSWAAVGATSALFAFSHVALALFLPLAVLGLVLGVLFERFGSLHPPVILHSLNNAIAILLIAGSV